MHDSTPRFLKQTSMALLLIAGTAFAADAGGPAPSFTLAALTGQQAALSQYKGQVVMVNFWATWCGPCQQEMPLLDQMYKKYKPAGFTLIGVNVDKEAPPVKELMARKPVSFPVLLDHIMYPPTAANHREIAMNTPKIVPAGPGYSALFIAKTARPIANVHAARVSILFTSSGASNP